jgi:hypothetical protein
MAIRRPKQPQEQKGETVYEDETGFRHPAQPHADAGDGLKIIGLVVQM